MTKEEKNQTSEEKKYFAFISYSHKDMKAAKKLHDFIEGYKLPANLNGKEDLPNRIRPVFRDEYELKGGQLTEQIQSALRNSRYLIVVCSPNSAKSYYCNQEIEYFKSLGREMQILPYIIDGKATTDEDPDCCYAPCFKDLQKNYDILGGDIRDIGAQAAALKIIAAMLEVEFPSLFNRFAKRERRKRNIIIAVSAAFVLLATIVALFIWNQNRELDKAYKDLQNEKAKVESEKKAKDKAYAELDLTNDSLFATKDSLEIKNIALSKTNRELNLANISLQESKSIILAENAMNKIEKGDYLGARRAALEAISLSYSPEAEAALRQSWESNSAILEGHSGSVYSVSWSPDGKYLASGAWDKTLIIYDAKSGEKLKTLEGLSEWVKSISWSPDGKYLASGLEDGNIIICDAKNGEKLKTLEGHSTTVTSVSWSPDEKYLASGSYDNTVIIWDAKSGEKLQTKEVHHDYGEYVCWSPDGKYLASSLEDGNIIICDAKSGEKLKTLEGHLGRVYSVCWSPDGKYLASGSTKTIKGKYFWNDYTYCGEIIIWDVNSGEKLKTLEGHGEWVWSVSWSPDGKYLASGSDDTTVIIWDAKSGKTLKTFESDSFNCFRSVAWSPNGKYLAGGSKIPDVIIWRLK